MAYFRCEKSTKILKNLLWINPSPTSAFSAQTISNIDLSKYDGVIVEIKPDTSYTITDTIYCDKNFNGWLKSGDNAERGWGFKRSLQIDGQSFIFGSGSGNNAINNGYVIPYKIYGYAYEPDMAIAEKKLIWNNPSPTAVFSAQTLSLDLSECDGVIIRCSWERTQNSDAHKALQIFNYIPKDGVSHNISSCTGTTAQIYVARRQATVTNNGITFSDATYGSGTNSSYIIPTEIYGYIYKDKIDKPDRRKFILKDGIFQGTQGTDYGVLGTPTQGVGYVTLAGTASFAYGIAPFISASDKTKYKRVVFDCDGTYSGFRLYTSTTESGTRTYIDTLRYAVNLNTLSDNIFLYLMPNGNTMNYYNIYLE